MNIHVNKTNNGTVEAVFHVPCPPGLNLVSIPWCDCVVHCGDYKTSSTKSLQKDDLPQIRTGEIIEVVEPYTFIKKDPTDAEKTEELEARFLVVKSKVQAVILNKLRYYGFEDNV